MITIAGRIKNLPSQPGIYFFKNKKGQVIYIGKSGNLKNRVKSYFSTQGELASGRLNAAKIKMLSEIASLEILRTDSEIEALVKEAELIKKYKPKFNVLMRDSKNYLFVGFTKEEYPRIITTHQPRKVTSFKFQVTSFMGPFTDASAVIKTLRMLRDIFPYCTCRQKHAARCLNAHLGKCIGICCLKNPDTKDITTKKAQYQKNVHVIKAILLGRKKSVIKSLEVELKQNIKNQNFEKANELKHQLADLNNILNHANILRDEQNISPAIFKDIAANFTLLRLTRDPKRIETYDVSNISGQEAVGAMVVFIKTNGGYKPDKSQYRLFKIRTVSGINDAAMMAEVIKRRFQHTEWPLPQLIIIDGGRGQLNAALRAVGQRKIRIVSLAKRLEEIYLPERAQPLPAQSFGQTTKHLFQAVRDEAHRFAITYHRKLHRQNILSR